MPDMLSVVVCGVLSKKDHRMSIISPHIPEDAELGLVELDLLKDEALG